MLFDVRSEVIATLLATYRDRCHSEVSLAAAGALVTPISCRPVKVAHATFKIRAWFQCLIRIFDVGRQSCVAAGYGSDVFMVQYTRRLGNTAGDLQTRERAGM